MQRQRLWQKILYELILILVAAFAVFPLLWMVLSSLKPANEILRWPIQFLPKRFTIVHYQEIFSSIPMARYLLNSAIIATVGTSVVVVTSALAAYAMAIIRVRRAGFFISLALLGLIIPVQVGFIPLFLVANALHLQNSYIGMVFPFLVSPFGVFLLTQFFRTIPHELVDAARIDGLKEGGIIRHVVIPLGRSGITTLVIFQFMMIWREFFWPLLVVTHEKMRPVTLGMTAYYFQDSVRHWGQILAATTTALIPILLVFAVFQRRFIAGITVGSVKG